MVNTLGNNGGAEAIEAAEAFKDGLASGQVSALDSISGKGQNMATGINPLEQAGGPVVAGPKPFM